MVTSRADPGKDKMSLEYLTVPKMWQEGARKKERDREREKEMIGACHKNTEPVWKDCH